LSEYLRQFILAPLGMVDTAFYVPAHELARLAEAFPKDPDTGSGVH